MKKKERHKKGWENQEYHPQRREKRKASRFNTPAEIRPFTSIFCYSVRLWSWRDIVHYSYPSISVSLPALSFLYSVFHTNCQFAVLWKEQSRFLLSPLFSRSPWESMLWKELIIGWHSSCFSVSWSLSLPCSLSFILPSFFGLFLTHTPPPLSFNFIWGWGLVKILSLFLSFTMLLSAFSAIVSH